MATDNVRGFPSSGFARKAEAKPPYRVREVPKMGAGVHALYRYYRETSEWPARKALLLARYHEGKPLAREASPEVRRLYRQYRQNCGWWSPADALRVARCHDQARRAQSSSDAIA
jgi:hypothetical protein